MYSKIKSRSTEQLHYERGQRSHNMNPCFIPFLSVNRWLVGKGVVFALLGLLALDGGLCATSTFAQSTTGFSISPSSLAYTATVGGPNQVLGVTITNTGTSTLTVTWTDPINWLVATSGDTVTMAPGGSATILHTASTSGLTAGTYSGTATISGGGTTKQVPITMTVTSGSATPAIGLSPTSLTFSGTAGGANPAAQTIGVSNTGSGTLTWTASDNAAWLTLTPTSGTNAGTMTASVNTAGLTAGTYNTTVSVAATGSTTKTLPVTLTVANASSTSGVTVTPSPIAFTGTVGTGPLTLPVTFKNSGTSSVSFTWTDSIPWIKAGYPAGTLSPGQSVTYLMTANISGMAAGSYSGTGSVTAGGVTKQVPVALTLTAATSTPAIGLNTASLGFAGTVGGTNPSAQTIGISNVGSGTLTWTTGDNATWLTLSPLSGTNTGTVTASVNLAGLLAGGYTATVTVTATGATAKTVPVTLTVTASTSGGTIGFSPASLAFSGTVGGTNPAAQAFALTNTGGGTLSWTLSDNATWLQLNTVSGTTTTETDTISASVTTSGLAAGTYNGIITVTASGASNNPRQIPVSLTLSATVAGTASLTWNANTDSDLAGYKVYQGTSSGIYTAPVATIPKTTTSYTVAGLQTGTSYFFIITAYDNAGNESLHSNEVSKSIY